MKKIIKKIVLFLSILLVVILFVFLFLGNYFFNYALVRKNSEVAGTNRKVSSSKSSLLRDQIETSKKEQIELANIWYDSTDKEYLTINSHDGLLLHGTKFVQSKHSSKYVIIVHGYGSNQSSVLDIAHNYYNCNFTPVTIDLKAHGKSEGKYIGMGWNDRKDILLWVNKILEMDSDAEFILHGVSMGAATVLMASGENDLSNKVKTVIADCGYTSAWEVFASELKLRFNLPSFPLLNSANFFVNLNAGYNLTDVSVVSQVKKSKVPTLFIHGLDDNFIPVEMVYELYDSSNAKKSLFIAENAGHNESRFVDKDKYYNVVFDFIDDSVGLEKK